MQILMKHQINTLFVGINGKYNGKLVFAGTKNVLLRKKQYLISDDERLALPIAKSIVLAKIKNELNFVQRIKRKNNCEDEFEKNIRSLKMILARTETADTLDELRGHEGLAARNYYSVFRYNLIPEWADFPRRSRNPPRSNVNAVLSFLYTLLMYRIEIAIETAGLDSMAGFLHVSDYGKNALVFDLMEEFRTPIADTLCCSLFNLGTLSPDDFETVEPEMAEDDMFNTVEDTENSESSSKAILLTKEGLKKVIAGFEKKIDTVLLYPPLEEKLSLNRIIIAQVKHLKRVILGEETVYRGYLYK
jgi:CRISPR-associated protein Cas1